MGGGVILMLVLLSQMPVPQAMVLHGVVQFVANGTRAATHRNHVWWRSVGWYSLGAGMAVTGLIIVKWLPDKRMICAPKNLSLLGHGSNHGLKSTVLELIPKTVGRDLLAHQLETGANRPEVLEAGLPEKPGLPGAAGVAFPSSD